ncbi:MAG: hypothetical protein Q8M08_03230 [Bacteroidales bacterium]|nr:hypothetical protein [Bacteroidales bacterium]
MKIKKIILVVLLLIPAMAFTGEIFGTISKNGKPFAKQLVKITAKDGTLIKSDSTDAFGYFSITIGQTGQVKLHAGGAIADIYSNNSPTAYKFDLVQNKSTWQLIKK